MLYAFLVAPVFEFGGDMIFVQAVRKIKPDFEYLIKGFMENYLSIVLANLLVFALVVLGLFALIIPGIIIACRLVFVSYIIMDKKLDPIEAVEMSWRLTRGHGWKIFFMGFVSFFIIHFGLLMLIVGIFPALIWISSSFASLYESVLREKEKLAEQLTWHRKRFPINMELKIVLSQPPPELLKKSFFTPKPPKGGFITYWISISPPWGI